MGGYLRADQIPVQDLYVAAVALAMGSPILPILLRGLSRLTGVGEPQLLGCGVLLNTHLCPLSPRQSTPQ